MLNVLLITANSLISLCYFTIAFLLLLPFLRGQHKTLLVLATIMVFFSCALGHGGHVLMMASSATHQNSLLLKFQVGIDWMTAIVAVTYIALRRYYSLLIDGPLILSQAQEKLELANAELAKINTTLELQVKERTNELLKTNERLATESAERKQAIAALNRSNTFLKAQQESAPDGILVVDENNQVLFYNRKFYQIWQIPESLVQQGNDRKILELVVTKPQNPEEFLAKVDYLYQHPEIVSKEDILLKDGRTLERYTAAVRSSEGAYYGRIWYFRDISLSKAASEALQASEARLKQKASQLEATLCELQQAQVQLIQSEKMSALGQLVAGIAHEINNPVNFIYGNLTHATQYVQELMDLLNCYQQEYPHPTELLQAKAEEIECDYLIADLPKLLSSMKVGAERIREIILSLRTFSRLDEASMKAVNLHDGIDSTLLILRSRLKTKAGIEIQVIKEYGDLPDVECYPGQLNQVFMNVLSNAIDALEFGNSEATPMIRIRTELIEKQVAIVIADNGSGIPESLGNRIFNPFFTTKPVGQGTGLGLSISYQIVVQKHGGIFKFTSVSGETEFWIEIPLYRS